MSKDFIQRVNDMGTNDNQPTGIHMPNLDENLTILDFLTTVDIDDSNASDESYPLTPKASNLQK